jgi:tRNA threonylcarbamoyladenosine biosynthesis protein TsaB
MRPVLAAGPPSGAHPTVLAIDTTAGSCSVALLAGDAVAVRSVPMTHGHSRHVLALVDAVLAQAGAAPSAVDAIGFGSGPGSFTGLRIACGIAQGLGLGWDRPVVAVDAMRTLGLQAAGAGVPVLVALDLRMGEACHAVFAAGAFDTGAWPEALTGPVLGPPAAALAAFAACAHARVRLAGDGFDAHPDLGDWARADAALRERPAGAVQPDAAAVARLAAVGLRTGRAIDAALAAPLYLRDKVALDVDEQAALRAARAQRG